MTKKEFEAALRGRLSGLPEDELKKSLEYYAEMIDERTECGMAEEEAVAELGPVETIASDILTATPLPKLLKKKVTPKRSLRGWEIALLILGSPLWLSLLLAAAAVILCIYVCLWTVAVSVYASAVAVGACAPAALVLAGMMLVRGKAAQGIFFAGAGLACAGLAVLLWLLGNLTARGAILAGKKLLLGIKYSIAGKEKKR